MDKLLRLVLKSEYAFWSLVEQAGMTAELAPKVTTQAKFRHPCWIQPKQGWGVKPLKAATSDSKILAPCLCIVAQ